MSSQQTGTDRDKRREEMDRNIRDNFVKLGFHGNREELLKFYCKHAENFNEMSDLAQYRELGCQHLIKAMAEWVPDKEAKILDVGAGTGLAGNELRRLHYCNIDALEPAEGMLKIAKAENIYKSYIMDTVTPDKRTSIDDGSYDVLVIVGAVLKGHVTLECLPELKRMTKKGGVIVFNVSEKYLKTDPQFQDDKHHQVFDKYVESGQWQKWDHFKAPYRETDECVIYRIVLRHKSDKAKIHLLPKFTQ